MGSETVRMIDCEDNITGQKQQSANTAHGLLSGQHHRTETAVSVHGPRSPVRTTSPDRNSSQRTRPRSPVRTTSPDRNSSQRTRPTVSCQDNITGQKQQSAYTAHGLLSGQHHRTLPTVSCQDNITGQKQQSAYTAHGLLSGHHWTENIGRAYTQGFIYPPPPPTGGYPPFVQLHPPITKYPHWGGYIQDTSPPWSDPPWSEKILYKSLPTHYTGRPANIF